RGAIGTYEDRVVGLALWTIDDAELMIEVLYVVPEARGLGLGEAVVRRAVEEARGRGCGSIAGRALPGDRETKNVFERTGLVSQVITVGKVLD
ncbi:MAG: GNAT family N-acetyltransferase, partial [Actinomycetota bacterium]